MDIKEVRANLGKEVHYTNGHLGLDGTYTLNACTIRMQDGQIRLQAELQHGKNSVLIAPLASVEAIIDEQEKT